MFRVEVVVSLWIRPSALTQGGFFVFFTTDVVGVFRLPESEVFTWVCLWFTFNKSGEVFCFVFVFFF